MIDQDNSSPRDDQARGTGEECRTIRIIAPSTSLATVHPDVRAVGAARLEQLGFRVEFGANVEHVALHRTASVAARLADLEAAIDDPAVDIVMAAQGGSNANQLLPRIDYARARRTRKIFVGYSDISALLSALGGHAGAEVVHGPNFIDLCNPILPDYTALGLVACLSGRSVRYASPAATATELWSHHDRSEPPGFVLFDGWKVHRPGRASAEIVGGNLVTLAALAGTPWFPATRGRILVLEDALGEGASVIHRELTHFAQLGVLDELAGLVIGMVPPGVALTRPGMLRAILTDVLPPGTEYPVVTDVSCSHVSPMISIPLFRPARLDLEGPPCLVVGVDRPGEPLSVEGSSALEQST